MKIAIIRGDGVGTEVVAEGLNVLEAAAAQTGFTYSLTEFPIGGQRYLDQGGNPAAPSIPVVTDKEIDELRSFDAIFLGAVGHPDIAPGIIEKGMLLKLRFELDQYINLRPVTLFPGVTTPLANKTPEDIDFLVVRENTEGLYAGSGGVLREGTQHEVSTQEMISTRHGAERCIRFAFEQAVARKAAGYEGKVTLVHKTNVLTFCGGTWKRAFDAVAAEFPDIKPDYNHVDACCMYMATTPESYDVVVVPNMFGDIITDLGAAIAGGMGMAASGNLNPDPAANSVSMFEPVHGSAPDIAGQGKANPVAAVCSLVMLLDQVGHITNDAAAIETAKKIDAAVRTTCAALSGQRMDRLEQSTAQVGEMIIAAL
ncbi:MAG: 3-isopropylmalate dehydrogenase [Phycisphaerales bacterium]|nr:3-isopropylmalate dehydrogenase [Phycisphaerales bacterium]MBT7171902.1 3-isopropylmalate dehydrogenase [Phycisphaerales bacterium]